MKLYISECGNMLYKAKSTPTYYDNIKKKELTLKEPTKEQINAFFRGIKVSEKKGDNFLYYDYDNARYFCTYCEVHKVNEYTKRFHGSDKRVDIDEAEYRLNLKD